MREDVVAPPALLQYFPYALLLAYFALGVSSLSGGHLWGDDWAQYLMHARNLAGGQPYGATGYMFNPDAPNVGPPSYPPGLPLLLAPVIALFGLKLALLKAVCFACLVAALPVWFRLLRVPAGAATAFVATALFALHDQVWALRDVVVSETPYILFSALALWYATRERPHPVGPGPQVLEGVVLGVLTYASVACRSLGVSLLLALLVYGWAQRRSMGWFLSLIAAFSLLVGMQHVLVVVPPTYSNELKIPTPGLLLENAKGYWMSLGHLFRLPFGLGKVTSTVVIALAMVGAWSLCRTLRPDERSGRGVRNLAARVPLSLWYLGAYLGALTLAAIAPGERYLLPVLPVVIALAAAGVCTLAGLVPAARRYALPAAVAIAFYYVVLHASVPRTRADAMATCEACEELYAFVRTQTAPDAVIAFAKPRAMALMGERASWMWSVDYSPNELRTGLRGAGATVLVVVAPETALAEKYPAALDFAGIAEKTGSEVLFQNRMFTVFRLGERAGGH